MTCSTSLEFTRLSDNISKITKVHHAHTQDSSNVTSTLSPNIHSSTPHNPDPDSSIKEIEDHVFQSDRKQSNSSSLIQTDTSSHYSTDESMNIPKKQILTKLMKKLSDKNYSGQDSTSVDRNETGDAGFIVPPFFFNLNLNTYR